MDRRQVSEDLFGSQEEVHPVLSASQGTSTLSSVSTSSQLPVSGTSEENEDDILEDTATYCARCKKHFKSAQAFLKHKLMHIQKDSANLVSEEDVYACVLLLSEDIFKDMGRDPAIGTFGEARKLFVNKLCSKQNSQEWTEFLKVVSDHIVPILSQKTNLMPQRQYESNLVSLNKLLANSHIQSLMLISLRNVEKSSEEVEQNFLYRFCLLMFKKVQVEVLKLMQKPKDVEQTDSPSVIISLEEQQVLYYSCGSIIKTLLRKGKKASKTSLWSQRLVCIQENFLFVDGEDYSLSFLQIKAWFDKVNRGGLTAINENLFKIFRNLEIIVRKEFSDKSKLSPSLNHEEILNEIVHVRNNNILSSWFALSHSLGEMESISLFQVVVKSFIKFSASAEASLRVRELEHDKDYHKVALRTDLKRN